MDTTTVTPTEPAETDATHATVLGAFVVSAGAVMLAGCGGGGGAGGGASGPLPPAVSVSGLTIAVTTSSAASVTIGNIAPIAPTVASMVAATNGRVRFVLNDGSSPTSGAKDPGYRGAERTYDYAISATDGTDSATAACYVTVNPAIERVLTGEPVLKLKHLLNRMAFGATEDDLARWVNLPYEQAVDTMVDEAMAGTTAQPPTAAATHRPLTWTNFLQLDTTERKAYDDRKGKLVNEIYYWWLREIHLTPHPLREKMALFWHNLFVVVAGDIFEPRAIWDYLDLLRTNALGSYRELLHGIARDPSMVMFLNSDSNVKGKPNENFARELMELFTLGEGQVYTEADVVAVAKCFTGWTKEYQIQSLNQTFKFRQDQHEPGSKQMFQGTAWALTTTAQDNDPEQVRKDGEAVIDQLLQIPRVAVFICEKLWDEFIGGTRNTAVINELAVTFRTNDYAISPVLKQLFRHSAFTSPANRGNMIRSPIELQAAIFRPLGVEPSSYSTYYSRASQEDQALLNPPNVRGWIGGLSWISTRSLLERRENMLGTGWEFHNGGRQKIPEHFRSGVETLWFATPVSDSAYVAGASAITWNPDGERIRRLLIDPSLNCK